MKTLGGTALASAPEAMAQAMTRQRILIIEDERALTDVLTYNFQREGYETILAHDGKEGLRKAQTLLPDIIVLDLMLPVMNGLEEARYLKKLMPAVPVIIYTVHSDPFVEKEARSAGAFAVVSKSESAGTLIAAARSVFEQVQ